MELKYCGLLFFIAFCCNATDAPKWKYGQAVVFKHKDPFFNLNCKNYGIIDGSWFSNSYTIREVECFSKGSRGLHKLNFTVYEEDVIREMTEEEYNKHEWR